jgi:ribonucleotide reductase alpha subunit
MDYSWGDKDSKRLNKEIFETIYYSVLSESNKIAYERKIYKRERLNELRGLWNNLINNSERITNPEEFLLKSKKLTDEINQIEVMETSYQTFEGSPASKGILQFDMWLDEAKKKDKELNLNLKYDWDTLKNNIKENGLRNSLLVALMPTASTAHLIGNNECFEPFTNMIYARTVLSGQFMVVNKYMINDLLELKLGTSSFYNKNLAYKIIKDGGSLQKLENPFEENSSEYKRLEYLKLKYRTIFEIPQKTLVELAIDRGPFICQTQSFNCFFKEPTYQKIASLLFYQWENGAKTGSYYIRTKPASEAIKFAVENTLEEIKKDKVEKKDKTKDITKVICTDEVCTICQ